MDKLDILVSGFPGKTTTHGSLGWSSVALLRGPKRTVLVDTGPPAYIALLRDRLSRCGVEPGDVTDILITHLHWDHVGNITMFPNADVAVGAAELHWATRQPSGTPHIPDLHVRLLREMPERVRLVQDGHQITPEISAIATPGHTPGHMCYRVSVDGRDVLFSGDAVKNRYELASGDVDSSMDRGTSRASVDMLRSLMAEGESVSIVPGHDVELALVDGEVRAMQEQRATLLVALDAARGPTPRSIT